MQRYFLTTSHEELKPVFGNNNMPRARATATTTDEMLSDDPFSVIETFDHHHEIVDIVEIDYDDIEDIMVEPIVSDFDLAFAAPDAALSGGSVVQQPDEEEEPIFSLSNSEVVGAFNTDDIAIRRLSNAASTVSASSSGSSKRSTWKDTPLAENYELGNWDVLCGRGKDAFNNVGNRRLRLLVAKNLGEYIEGSRRGKTQVIHHIVDQVYQATGRFVKRNPSDDGWLQICHAQARDKVGHIFRDSLRQQKHKKKNKSSSDSPAKDNKIKKTASDKTKETTSTTKVTTSNTKKPTTTTTTTTTNHKKKQELHASQNSIFRSMNLYCAQRTASVVGSGVQDMKCVPDQATSSLLNLVVPL